MSFEGGMAAWGVLKAVFLSGSVNLSGWSLLFACMAFSGGV